MTWEWYIPESFSVWRHPWGCGYKHLYRIYANRLNWNRPRGHKISWKKLNRSQRNDVEILAKQAHDRNMTFRDYLEIIHDLATAARI